MKNLPTFVEKPELWDDPYFNDFMEQAEFAKMSFEEQEAYIASMKQKWDYDNSIEFAEQKGVEKGRAEGKEEGKAEQNIENARSLKALGVDIKIIAKALKLSEEQIKAL